MAAERWILCALEDIPNPGARGFDPLNEGKNSVFVVRQQGEVFAYRDRCPHLDGMTLPWKKDNYLNAAGQAIQCAAHGAQFNIETGLCTSGPCLGQYLSKLTVGVSSRGQISISKAELAGGE
ncbi:Rieske (2Fe-2S) protein [Halioxenophilus aromaticivorans]|uniref:Rieske (2Fe-2S) protein n=1 Tax=Halioxenophilus aromaticivorans TaxID=1306992 RepID=A0AAV3U307_9ALTE